MIGLHTTTTSTVQTSRTHVKRARIPGLETDLIKLKRNALLQSVICDPEEPVAIGYRTTSWNFMTSFGLNSTYIDDLYFTNELANIFEWTKDEITAKQNG